MKTSTLNRWSAWRLLTGLFIGLTLMAGCSSNSSSGSDTIAGVGTGGTGNLSGVAKVDITDASAVNFSNVYVTVTSVAFHTDSKAAFSSYSTSKVNGWQIFRLASPITIDLAQLSNGTTYSDINGSPLFNGLNLPVGNYNQIRLFLASTEDAYLGSIPGLTYNNEVKLIGDTTEYPLRVPSPSEGIMVRPESPIIVTSGGNISLTLDFKLGDDVVEVTPNGSIEFILKPRLGYFDMESIGAAKGKVNFSNLSTSAIEVKAEQVDSTIGYRVVRRTTAINKTTGKFSLYPLPIFGNATTANYDILLRGHNIQTAIVKNVKIHRGSTPKTAADLGTIIMQPDSEFTAQLNSVIHPTGSWLDFYQLISGDSVPFEVRYRHLDPYTGKFGSAIGLSTGPIQVATFSPGISPVFSPDNSSQGTYSIFVDNVGLFSRGAPLLGISGSAGQNKLLDLTPQNYPQPIPGASYGTISCVFDMALLGTGTGPGMGLGNRNISNPLKGQVFITNGGMIIDSIGNENGNTSIGIAMHAGGGSNNPITLSNLPSNVAGAVYGIYALGWGSGVLVGGNTLGIDLTMGGNITTNLTLH